MDIYAVVKTVHILSATIVFGTGLGTAFFFWRAHAQGNEAGRLIAARTTVLADWVFTMPAVLLQPITGVWLITMAGIKEMLRIGGPQASRGIGMMTAAFGIGQITAPFTVSLFAGSNNAFTIGSIIAAMALVLSNCVLSTDAARVTRPETPAPPTRCDHHER